jgi:heptaprenyl diphosphate synthase
MKSELQASKQLLLIGLFTAASVTVYILELMLPRPLPFLKIGLANVFVLILLINHCVKIGLIVTVAKSLIGGFFSGLLISPTTLFSLGGSLAAFSIMFLLVTSKIPFSTVGISISGAVFHNLAQIGLVYFVLIREKSLFLLIPLLMILGIITGSISGYFAYLLNNKINFLFETIE